MSVRKIIIIIIAAVAVGIFYWFDLHSMLTLENLKTKRQLLQEYHTTHRVAMVAGYIALYILQTALSLPGALIFTLAAGAVFGVAAGTLYAVTASLLGATTAFLLTRYLLHDSVMRKFGDRLAGINRELEARGFNYLLFLRLIPVFPFFLINLAAGLTSIPLRTFFLATLIGIIPGGFVFVNAGSALAEIRSTADILSARMLLSFTLLGLFAMVPVWYNRLKNNTNKER